jgi:hypothetical protein
MCVTHPAHFILHHPQRICWRVQFMKLLIMQTSPASRHFHFLASKYTPQHPVPKHLHILHILIFMF